MEKVRFTEQDLKILQEYQNKEPDEQSYFRELLIDKVSEEDLVPWLDRIIDKYLTRETQEEIEAKIKSRKEREEEIKKVRYKANFTRKKQTTQAENLLLQITWWVSQNPKNKLFNLANGTAMNDYDNKVSGEISNFKNWLWDLRSKITAKDSKEKNNICEQMRLQIKDTRNIMQQFMKTNNKHIQNIKNKYPALMSQVPIFWSLSTMDDVLIRMSNEVTYISSKWNSFLSSRFMENQLLQVVKSIEKIISQFDQFRDILQKIQDWEKLQKSETDWTLTEKYYIWWLGKNPDKLAT